jgi:hypothetical protein
MSQNLLSNDRLRIGLNLLFALLPIPTSAVMFTGDFEEQSAKGPIATTPELALPAEYAFAIWFPIFLGWIFYGVYQALPRQHHHPLFRDIGWLAAGNLVAIFFFFIFARLGPAYMVIPTMVAQFLTTAIAFLRLCQMTGPRSRMHRFMEILFGVNVGWLTAALVITFTATLPEYGISIFGLAPVPKALFVIAVSTLMAGTLIWKSKASLPYALTLVWAVAAIIVRNAGDPERMPIVVAAFAAGGVLAVLTGYRWFTRAPQTLQS